MIGMPDWRDVLYRLPWSVGLICSAYLAIGKFIASKTSFQIEQWWTQGFFWESYFAASLLLYALLICIAAVAFKGWKRKDIAGILIIMLFFYVLAVFWYCFLHKTKGYVVWPMDT